MDFPEGRTARKAALAAAMLVACVALSGTATAATSQACDTVVLNCGSISITRTGGDCTRVGGSSNWYAARVDCTASDYVITVTALNWVEDGTVTGSTGVSGPGSCALASDSRDFQALPLGSGSASFTMTVHCDAFSITFGQCGWYEVHASARYEGLASTMLLSVHAPRVDAGCVPW